MTLPAVESVDPLASVRVPVVVLTVKPFKLVAVATPRAGVVSVGLVARTMLPVPCGALPIAVKTVLLVVTVEGATPAPPPTIIELAAKAADEASVEVLL